MEERAPEPLDPNLVREDPAAKLEPDTGPLIVGIGGSAGSLSPLRDLLGALPVDCGIAFVVVSHQAPTGHSMLPEILAKCTQLPVREIAGEIRVEPDHVYVGPRGQSVAIHGGVLSLERVALRAGPHLPIDLFFRTLARDQGSRAAGIVLSGTGTDGTFGLAAIRAASGFSLVQDPATAEFDGMPVSAIRARAVDIVLAPTEMPGRLLALRAGLASRPRTSVAPGIRDIEIEQVLDVMRRCGGHEFTEYKRETLLRRVERRMHLHGFDSAEDYARFLEESGAEVDALWHDWLIGVSGFFRDREVFQALEPALSELIAGREDGSGLRIWVPGCATGEEVYSLVIVLLEILRRLKKHLKVQVFATDLNPAAIQIARAGRYPEGIAAEVSEQRLARFFAREDEFHRVNKAVRDLVVFAAHDVLHDPPFTRIDLVSCRNVLIYLEPGAQRRLLQAFHYSLNPHGLLLLGTSEHAAGSDEFFLPLDAHSKIYRRNDATTPQPTLRWPHAHRANRDVVVGLHVAGAKIDMSNLLSRALAEHFAPPAVLVDERGQIQQVHGRVGVFLELPVGRVNVNVVDMAREGFRLPIASLLREASGMEGRIAERTVRTQIEGDRLTLNLKASRLDEPRLSAPWYVVSFETTKRKPQKRARNGEKIADGRSTDHGTLLEQELRDTRRDLQSSIDELQRANEELAAANEEAQSANEELQSANEELQTAKEETQSLNEELNTVNAELTQKLESFERATDDLINLMNNIEVATIFLDCKLRVMRFTPQARSVAHLIDADIGRPLADLTIVLDYPELLSDAATVIKVLHASERQALASDGSWYLVRIRPYRTARNTVDGVVVTFVDITDAKRNERSEAARVLAEGIVDAVREPFLVLDARLRVVRANSAFCRSFRIESSQIDGQLVGDLGGDQWVTPSLRKSLGKVLREGVGFDDFETEAEFSHLGRRRLLLSARPVSPDGGKTADLILLGIQEIHELQTAASRPEVKRP